ncbi:MAG: hypothetical protein ACREUV_04340 [Burkholderiales bacterium]
MNFRKIFIAVLTLLCCTQTSFAGDKFSEAEILMFETNHMKKITQPAKLQYSFTKNGSLEEGFADSADIFVDQVRPKGFKSFSTHYLNGKNNIPFPAVPQTDRGGNPVVLYFLERDIREMKRLTGGSVNYFRKSIRVALADKAEMRTVKITFDGKERDGKEIRITPYVNDQLKGRFGKHVGKYYVFTFSEDVPGTVYQMRCVTPDPEAGKPPLIEETLTISKAGKKG